MHADEDAPTTPNGSSNVLWTPTPDYETEEDGCLELLTPRDVTDGVSALVVTFRQTPEEVLTDWDRRPGVSRPRRLHFIGAENVAGYNSEQWPRDGENGTELVVEAVDDVADLATLGVRISSVLSEFEATGDEIVTYFGPISSLLETRELSDVFRFLHILTGRMQTVDANAYFHIDRDDYSEETMSTLKRLFEPIEAVETK